VHIVNHATGLGLSIARAANILSIIAGLSIVGKIALGSLADRISNRTALILSFILSSSALLWLAPAKESWMLYLFAIVFGFSWGAGALQAPFLSELFGHGSLGALLGIIDLSSNLGGTAGPVLAGKIFDMVAGYQPAFLTCATLGIISIILILLLRLPRKRI